MCLGRDSNSYGPFGPRDFTYHYSFHYHSFNLTNSPEQSNESFKRLNVCGLDFLLTILKSPESVHAPYATKTRLPLVQTVFST